MASGSASDTENQAESSPQLTPKIPWVHGATFWSQVGLGIIGLCALFIYGCQLHVMQGQLTEMKRSGEQSTQQMWSAIGNINWEARSMDWSQKVSQRGVDGSVDALEQEQRAWVGPVQASPPPYVEGGKAVYIKAGEPPLFWFMISNSGRSPARNFTGIIETHIYRANEKFVPVYRNGGNNGGNIGTVGVLFPGVPMQIDSLKTTGGMDAAHVALLAKEETIYYIYGKIQYSDVFGKPHKTEFCSYVRKDLASLVMCPTYNDAD